LHIRNSFLAKRQPDLFVREIRLEKRQSRVARLAVMAITLITLLVFAADMELCIISVSDNAHLRLAYPWQEGGVVISPIWEQDGLLKEGIYIFQLSLSLTFKVNSRDVLHYLR
jgi:hypothetical protein